MSNATRVCGFSSTSSIINYPLQKIYLMFKHVFFVFFFSILLLCNGGFAQSSNQYKSLVSDHKNNLFPKKMIYDAPKLPISYLDYNRLGFDYISSYSLENPTKVPNRYKYILWTGVASNDAKAKWATEKSPFVDDIDQYARRWDNRLNYYRKTYENPYDKDGFGVMILDIESKKNNTQLEKDPPYRVGGPKNKHIAIEEYKLEMEQLYRYPLEFAKKSHNYYKVWSSYSDIPIERNWWGIPNKSWHEWTTDPSHLNYITNTTYRKKTRETKFSQQLDFYSVSTYFFYNPEISGKNTANQYLAYLLFQLEANQAWTEKPIYLYYTFKYQGTKERGTLISADMVRNSVVFAFLSGADGMVLYDDSREVTSDPNYHNLIKTFVESISSLDKYRSYFEDKNVVFYKPDNARDLFVEKKTVVRGIENNGRLLIAATNPFAGENETTNIPIYYKGKYINIKLVGKETYLEEIIL